MEELGHIVVDVNLKDRCILLTEEEMGLVSKALMKDLIKFDITTHGEIYDCASEFCGEQRHAAVVVT